MVTEERPHNIDILDSILVVGEVKKMHRREDGKTQPPFQAHTVKKKKESAPTAKQSSTNSIKEVSLSVLLLNTVVRQRH